MVFTILNSQNTYIIHHKIDNDGFEEEELVDLKIAINDPWLIFIEEDEFIYNGLLFDVVTLDKQNGWYNIKAYWDKKEEKLTAEFIAKTERQHENKKQHSSITIKQVIKDYTPTAEVQSHYLSVSVSDEIPGNYFYLPDTYQHIFIPPPEV